MNFLENCYLVCSVLCKYGFNIIFILFTNFIKLVEIGLGLNICDNTVLPNRKNMPKRKIATNCDKNQTKASKLKMDSDMVPKKHYKKPKKQPTELANISHKNISGSDNWKRFLVTNNTNNNLSSTSNSRNLKHRKEDIDLKDVNTATSYKQNFSGPKHNELLSTGTENLKLANNSRKPFKNIGLQKSSPKGNFSLMDKPRSIRSQYSVDLTKPNSTLHVNPSEKDVVSNQDKLFNAPRPTNSDFRTNLSTGSSKSHPKNNRPSTNEPKLTKQIAIDCEMVGVEVGVKNDMLARVSLVNYEGDCVYDKFVKPTEPVIDYRTRVSGVRQEDLENGTDFKIVQKEVSDIITGRVLVGHALKNDLKVLFLTHPKYLIRDSSRFKKFREGRTPALKNLAKKYLGVEIQGGEHSSIQDALAAMQLYKMFRKEWESSIRTRKPHSNIHNNPSQAAEFGS